MQHQKCLICKDNKTEIHEASNYLKFIYDTFFPGENIKIYDFDELQLKKALNEILDTLTPREETILRSRYGLNDDSNKCLSLKKIAEEYNCTQAFVRQIEQKALRKLKHPTRRRRFIEHFPHIDNETNTIVDFWGSQFTKDDLEHLNAALENELKKEVYSAIIDEDFSGCFLKKVMKKKNLLFSFMPIENLGLSVRTFNCLKRADYNTIEDVISVPEEDLMKVRNLGKVSFQEIIDIRLRNDLEILTVDPIFQESKDKNIIADSIYKRYFSSTPTTNTIFNENFSSMLKYLLLENGYLHSNDVKQDILSLVTQLNNCGLQRYANELKKYYSTVCIYPLDENLLNKTKDEKLPLENPKTMDLETPKCSNDSQYAPNSNVSSEPEYPGQRKCKLLKQLRREIAASNNIIYLAAECTHKGPCKGTCPACDAEIKYLENELNERASRGEKIILSELSLDSFIDYVGNSSVHSFSRTSDPDKALEEMHSGRMNPVSFSGSNEELVIEDGHMPKFYRYR